MGIRSGILRHLLMICAGLAAYPAKAPLYEIPSRAPTCDYALRDLAFRSEATHSLRTLPESAPALVEMIQNELGLLAPGGPTLPRHLYSVDGGGCLSCSVGMQLALYGVGIDARQIRVSHAMEMNVDGGPKQNVSLHEFVFVAAQGARDEVIIDSTYLQFLAPGSRAGNSPVFVGTRQGLIDFFTRNRGAILRNPTLTRRAENVDPESFVDLTYGFGPAARTRQSP